MVLYIVLVILISALGLLLRTPWFKGWFGELQVNFATRMLLPGDEYKLIRDVTLPAGDGTTQIDHIVLSRYGVFVIETKNWSGRICGREKEPRWTQMCGRQSYRQQNPLRQNFKHTRTLTELLELPVDCIHSVICFVGEAKLAKSMPPNVTVRSGCVDHIRSFKEPVLTEAQVQTAVQRIEVARLARGMQTNRRHVRHVRSLIDSDRPGRPPAAPPADSC